MFEVTTLSGVSRLWSAERLKAALQDDPLIAGVPLVVSDTAELSLLLDRNVEGIELALRRDGIWRGQDRGAQPIAVRYGGSDAS